MLSFNEILEKVEHEISQLSFEYPPNSLYDPIEYILSLGGKRIRPALALMACNLKKILITSSTRHWVLKYSTTSPCFMMT